MKILGIIVIIFGIADLGLSFADIDIWGQYIGVRLPDPIWSFSGAIEIAIGYGLLKLARKGKDNEAGEED